MNLLSQAFHFLQQRKPWLFAGSAALILLCLLPLWEKSFDMDIRVMLPQGENGSITRDLSLLEHSPLSASVFILVQGKTSSSEALAKVGDRIMTELNGKDLDFFDLSSVDYTQAMAYLVDNAPRLMEAADLERLAKVLEPEHLRTQLAENRRLLLTFQGMALKKTIQTDPLGMRSILASRFAPFANLPQVRIASGRLFSADGHSLLLTARTDVPVTDAAGSTRLMEQIAAVRGALPQNVTVDVISGHALAVANAKTLKSDLALITCLAPILFVCLFLFLIRSPKALVLYFTPLVALAAAMGALAASVPRISAIVIAFGAVLLGIAEDYGMYVYFAMASHPESPGEALAAVSKPIFLTAATTCAAFAVFLLSDIPGQRQLAVYFLAGLGMAAVFSLFVLPQVFGRLTLPKTPTVRPRGTGGPRHPVWAACVCVLLTGLCVGAALNLRFDSDLRNLGTRPESVRLAEQRLAAAFGDVRGRAVLFVQGRDSEEALRKNERVWDALKRDIPDGKAVSLAPLLPALSTQQANLLRWENFWTKERIDDAQRIFSREAVALGFTPGAFAPLALTLNHPCAPLTLETLRRYGLTAATTLFAQQGEDGAQTFLSLIPDTQRTLQYFTPERERKLGVHFVSTTRFRHSLEQSMKSEIVRLLGTSTAIVLLLSAVMFRNPRLFFMAMTPPCMGLAAVLGWLGATGTPLNIFHIAALPLVVGMGVGFGIFLISIEQCTMPLATRKAVLTTGLSTLGGFGVLALAKHPALHSMGLAVLLGVGVALAVALLALPQLIRRRP